MRYALTLTPDDNDTLLVTCADLPEVTSFGEGEADAIAHGTDAVSEALAARLARFEPIPKPQAATGPLATVPTSLALKVLLFWSLEEAGVNRAELARRMGQHRPQVDRLFDPAHATRLDQFDAAFRALGRIVDLTPADLVAA